MLISIPNLNAKSFFSILFSFLTVPTMANAGLIYYNDGTVNDFSETFGDVGVGVAWNESFGPGGFMDGTSDDIAPYNTIDNRGLVTLQGAAGGVAGGGFRLQVNPNAGAAGKKGAVILSYGTQAQKKQSAGPAWIARFKRLGQSLGVNPQQAVDIWKNQGAFVDGKTTKLVKYTGDPLVSVPPTDLNPIDLATLNNTAISNALSDDNVQVFFWEVTGTKEMGLLDILFGDFGLNTGYADVLHHFPYLAVLDNVSPTDLGISAASANVIQFNGDSLGGASPFVGSMGIATFDPLSVSEPSSMYLFASFWLLIYGRTRKARL